MKKSPKTTDKIFKPSFFFRSPHFQSIMASSRLRLHRNNIMVKNAKEETIKLINIASGKIPETASSGELVKIILDLSLETDSLPVNTAIDEIKKEIQKIF